jgi:hypothetical protein
MKKTHDRVLTRPAGHYPPKFSRMNCDGVHTLQPSWPINLGAAAITQEHLLRQVCDPVDTLEWR